MTWEVARTQQLQSAALARGGQAEAAAREQAAADQALASLGVVNDRVIEAALAAM